MEHSHTITLSDLLHFPRPLTASASLPFLSTPPSPPPHHSTHHRIITTLNRPTVILGTLTLPTHTSPSSHFPCSCFKFSDGSATVCCDILSFRLAAVGKQIRVTAWNFIPFKNPGTKTGLLEIIKWCFSNPNDESNFADLLPVMPNSSVTSCNNGGKYFRAVHGVVKSVGPISIVPCATPANGSYDLNSSSKVNYLGFLVELLCCECRLCGSRDLVNNLKNGSFQIENMNGHSFTKMEILYFCGNASSFHPVMSKLIGNRVVVLGLKKKLVCLTKDESCLMYLTLDEMVLRGCPRLEKLVPSLKSEIKGRASVVVILV
ncbi:conserved telomere maintenance component [Trifolium repens]|nr:conserved telomere maintenance component [Trifolium repens]